jgi:hypothetical protein
LIQLALATDPDLPDVPLLLDLARNPTEAAIFRLISTDVVMGFPVAAPPATAPERMAALRKAFAATMADPAFLADAKKRGLPIRPSSGDEVQKIMASIIATPTDVVAILKQSIAEAKADASGAR